MADVVVAACAAGDGFSFALDSQGALHSSGEWRSGALGRARGVGFDRVYVTDRITGNAERVRSVSCGCAHAACVTDEGRVYTWGGGFSEHWQALGRGPKQGDEPLSITCKPVLARRTMTERETPRGDVRVRPALHDVVHVAAGGSREPGASSTVAVLGDGSVWLAAGGKYLPYSHWFAEIRPAFGHDPESSSDDSETSSDSES